MTVDRYSWGYRREAKIQDMLNMTQLLQLFCFHGQVTIVTTVAMVTFLLPT